MGDGGGLSGALAAAGSGLGGLLGVGRGGDAEDVEAGAPAAQAAAGSAEEEGSGGVFARLLGGGATAAADGGGGAAPAPSAAEGRWGRLRAAMTLGGLSSDAQSGDDEDSELRRMAESVSGYFRMSYETRVKGFAICLTLAVLCSLTSWLLLFSLALTSFAIIYSLGNALGLASTFFLMGPRAQLKRMFSKRRWASACVYLFCLAGTLYFALVAQVFVLVLVFMIAQWLALWWYALSYIPGAQRVVGGCVRTCFD